MSTFKEPEVSAEFVKKGTQPNVQLPPTFPGVSGQPVISQDGVKGWMGHGNKSQWEQGLEARGGPTVTPKRSSLCRVQRRILARSQLTACGD